MKSLCTAADGLVDGMIKLCFFVSAILMLALVFVSAGDAFGTAVFQQGIPAATEISAALLAAMVATALPYAQARNEHIVVDILTCRLKGWVARFFSVVALLTTLAVFVLLSYVMLIGAQASIQSREFASAAIAFPIYPFKVVFAFGVIAMTLELVRQGARAICARPAANA